MSEASRAQAPRTADYESGSVPLFDATSVGMAILDPRARRLLRSNRALGVITGYSAAELQGMRLEQLESSYDEDRHGNHNGAGSPLASDERAADRRWRRKDGGEVWVQISEDALLDSAGQATGVVIVVHDVTARRHAEELLRQSDARFRWAADAMQALVYDVDVSGDPSAAPAQAYGIEHVVGAEGIGSTLTSAWWHARIHPDDLPAHLENLERTLHGGDSASYRAEYRVRHTDGSWRDVQDMAQVFRDPQGRPVRLVGTIIDVTVRKRAVEALQESEQRFRVMADNSPVMIWVTDTRGSVEFVNEAYRRFFGVSEAEIGGEGGWYPLVHPDDAERAIEVMMSAIRVGRSFSSESRVRGADGDWHWIASEGTARFSHDGTFLGHVGSSVDITERKRAEEALHDANRRKDTFLAILAHELRNPLNPIKSAVEVLRLRGPQQPELVWGRNVIGRQVDNLSRLIEDLLDVSRISRGTLELRREPVELATILDEAVVASRPLIDARRHELRVRLPAEPIVLHADVVRLTQVFLNLLNNAAKYTPEQGRIWLSADREGHEAVVRVRDTGVGIAPAQLPNLFDMFYQADRGVERSHGGLGIGLTLVHRLIRLHGGSVQAFSAGVGEGAEFVVRLPVAHASEAGPGARSGEAGATPAPRRILIVDDNEDSADTLAELLRIHGSVVRTANDGASALEVAGEWRPEVVLLDIGMPRMSGYEVCRRLRAEAWGQGMIVIAQTGWGSQEDRLRSAQAGFDLHLTKPVDPTKLLRILAELPVAAPES